MGPDSAAIVVKNLKRTYSDRSGLFAKQKHVIEAVKDISFSVNHGELFVMVGPNGAGKTTTMKVLTSLLLPTSGRVSVLGLDVAKQPRELKKRIGFVFGGERGLYWRLSGKDNLKYFATLYSIPRGVAKERVANLLEMVGLAGRQDSRVEQYSRGMKQRLHIARGLLNDPEVLFLDEPTLGLDPVAARDIRKMITRIVQEGKTVFMTTHYMFEADELADRVAVVKKGEIAALEKPKDLKKVVEDLSVISIIGTGIPSTVVEDIKTREDVAAVSQKTFDNYQYLRIQSSETEKLLKATLSMLKDCEIESVEVVKPTLEDAYIRLVTE
jgi:ABC-2 type transport system ATP-binding protein